MYGHARRSPGRSTSKSLLSLVPEITAFEGLQVLAGGKISHRRLRQYRRFGRCACAAYDFSLAGRLVLRGHGGERGKGHVGTKAQLLETLAPFGETLECGVCELREALKYPAMPPPHKR
jgi:hypothetical protein